MKKIVLSAIIAANVLAANDYSYEITPMIGYVNTKDHVDIENHGVVGVGVARNLDSKYLLDKLELGLLQSGNADYENSSKDTKVTLLSLNAIEEYTITERFKLYALAGLGYERISNSEFNNESDPFFNYGVGAAYSITNELSLKLDARHELKFDGDKNIIYTLGLAIPFGQKASKQVEVVATPKVVKAVVLDSDQDGIANSLDKCPTTVAGVSVDKDGCEVLSAPADLGIVFETNSAKIKKSDLYKFEKYVNYLSRVPEAKILLEAHTDSVGDANYNLELSQKRANSTKSQLVSMGVDEDRINAVGYGETKPLVANDTVENKAKNRRVTAQIEK
jgi:OOP family OmpA-OmpF porin